MGLFLGWDAYRKCLAQGMDTNCCCNVKFRIGFLLPSLLIVFLTVSASRFISCIIIVLGFCLYPFLVLVKEKPWEIGPRGIQTNFRRYFRVTVGSRTWR